MFDRNCSHPTDVLRTAKAVQLGFLIVILTARDGLASASPNSADWSEEVIEPLEHVVAVFSAGLRERLTRVGATGADLDVVGSALTAAGWSPARLLAGVVAVLVTGLAAHLVAARTLGVAIEGRDRWITRSLLTAASALGAGLIAAYFVSGEAEAAHRTFRAWALVVPLAALASTLIRVMVVVAAPPPLPRKRLSPLASGLAAAVAWALGGIAVLTTLAAWGAGSGLRDLVGTAFVALPTAGLIITAYGRSRRPLAAALAGPRPRTHGRRFLARRWPAIAVSIVVVTVVVLQVARTLGQPLPALATLVTLTLVLMWPHVDGLIAVWAERGFRADAVPAASVAARRTARLALAALIGAALIAMWGAPAASGFGIRLGTLAQATLGIAAIMLATAYLWNLIGVASDRLLTEERASQGGHVGDEVEQAPRSRLGTLLPLVAGAAKAGLAALAALSILLALGINVWPLVTGLSVFGLAIGFGSQSLVKDVVSGLFFLADDAFRLGEYIETAGAKGRIEKISIRSVSLRHPRGALATIPYGQIGKVQNYSRDWVIEKLAFRVAFDTDVEKVRKLFKQIGQELADNPEFKMDLLETFKSQGIAAVEDGTLVIRGKFKARAGHQFGIRKAALAAVQRAFHDNGIIAVARPVVLSETQHEK
ncbi:mechanosensitive ion channel domain-containing protein [Methylobacterium nodulans]|uniref:MscS Mechanosensitive ion channel n=1 Tax=Methylobacterium nodulans (strain LMG 21967 / CNCM I-2342 / ORS 2060) TaxID=460265 RepID=B8II54_METNO|nr:mechanosensitive ion channel domain-containing protein [Methylobacterium nodulans]ACL57923.1 MscS Mechanosensitive ion channel [Methylobacterium nodulans ORS 2060]